MKQSCACGKTFWPAQKWQHEACLSSSPKSSPVTLEEAPQAKARVSQLASQPPLASSTYRHRDPEKRRVYQRDLMRSKRRAARRVSP
jgi:hypothetical protein